MPLHVGEKTPWGHVVSQSDLTNPKFNIRWSTWFFSQQVRSTAVADAAYNQGYNPGYTGPPLTSLLPKGYVPRRVFRRPTRARLPRRRPPPPQAAKAQTFDKWAVLDEQGHHPVHEHRRPDQAAEERVEVRRHTADAELVHAGLEADLPGHVLRTRAGRRRGSRSPRSSRVAVDLHALQPACDRPARGFDKSPVWKQHAPGLVQYAKGILGNNWKPSGGIIRQAIAQNWDQATFYAHLRQLPAYEKGPEFQDNLAKFTSIAESDLRQAGRVMAPRAARL
jgi:hypothetical protein